MKETDQMPMNTHRKLQLFSNRSHQIESERRLNRDFTCLKIENKNDKNSFFPETSSV